MDYNKLFLAASAYAVDEIIPKLSSNTDRFLGYAALVAYKGRIDSFFKSNERAFTEIGILEAGQINLSKVKEIVQFAFEKEPEFSINVPAIRTELKFRREDFDRLMQYIEASNASQ